MLPLVLRVLVADCGYLAEHEIQKWTYTIDRILRHRATRKKTRRKQELVRDLDESRNDVAKSHLPAVVLGESGGRANGARDDGAKSGHTPTPASRHFFTAYLR